jgi:hypothetical protein
MKVKIFCLQKVAGETPPSFFISGNPIVELENVPEKVGQGQKRIRVPSRCP